MLDVLRADKSLEETAVSAVLIDSDFWERFVSFLTVSSMEYARYSLLMLFTEY
jgi:hypothetical protein